MKLLTILMFLVLTSVVTFGHNLTCSSLGYENEISLTQDFNTRVDVEGIGWIQPILTSESSLNFSSSNNFVKAVILTSYNDSTVLDYGTGVYYGNNLATPIRNDATRGNITEVSFCYNSSQYKATLKGKVLDTKGRGVSGLQVTLIDGESGDKITYTDRKGNFTFNDLTIGKSYTVAPQGYKAQFVEITGELTSIQFNLQ